MLSAAGRNLVAAVGVLVALDRGSTAASGSSHQAGVGGRAVVHDRTRSASVAQRRDRPARQCEPSVWAGRDSRTISAATTIARPDAQAMRWACPADSTQAPGRAPRRHMGETLPGRAADGSSGWFSGSDGLVPAVQHRPSVAQLARSGSRGFPGSVVEPRRAWLPRRRCSRRASRGTPGAVGPSPHGWQGSEAGLLRLVRSGPVVYQSPQYGPRLSAGRLELDGATTSIAVARRSSSPTGAVPSHAAGEDVFSRSVPRSAGSRADGAGASIEHRPRVPKVCARCRRPHRQGRPRDTAVADSLHDQAMSPASLARPGRPSVERELRAVRAAISDGIRKVWNGSPA